MRNKWFRHYSALWLSHIIQHFLIPFISYIFIFKLSFYKFIHAYNVFMHTMYCDKTLSQASSQTYQPHSSLHFHFFIKLNSFIHSTSHHSFPSLLSSHSILPLSSPPPQSIPHVFLFRNDQTSCGYQQSVIYQVEVGPSTSPFLQTG